MSRAATKPTPKRTVTRQVTETEQHLFSGAEIVEALRMAGKLPHALPQTNLTERISESIKVEVDVPRGGDYSGCTLDLDDQDAPVRVTITRHSSTTT